MRVVGGIVTALSRKYTSKGDLMATFVLEDLAAAVEVMVFPRTMTRLRPPARGRRHRLREGPRSTCATTQPKLIAMEITRPEIVLDGGPPGADPRSKLSALSDDGVRAAEGDPAEHPGDSPVFVHLEGARQDHRAPARRRLRVDAEQRPLRRAPRPPRRRLHRLTRARACEPGYPAAAFAHWRCDCALVSGTRDAITTTTIRANAVGRAITVTSADAGTDRARRATAPREHRRARRDGPGRARARGSARQRRARRSSPGRATPSRAEAVVAELRDAVGRPARRPSTPAPTTRPPRRATSWSSPPRGTGAVDTAAAARRRARGQGRSSSMANGLEKVGREFRPVLPTRASLAAGDPGRRARRAGGRGVPARPRGRVRRARRARCESDVVVCGDDDDARDVVIGLVAGIPEPARVRRRLAARTRSGIEAFAAVLLTVNLRHKGEGDAAHPRRRGLRPAELTIRLYDTAQRAGRAVRARPGRAHVRVRHHAVRLHAPRPRGHATSPTTCSSAGSRSSATRCAWCATSPTSTTRSCRRRASSACPYLELAEAELARFHADMDALEMRPPSPSRAPPRRSTG